MPLLAEEVPFAVSVAMMGQVTRAVEVAGDEDQTRVRVDGLNMRYDVELSWPSRTLIFHKVDDVGVGEQERFVKCNKLWRWTRVPSNGTAGDRTLRKFHSFLGFYRPLSLARTFLRFQPPSTCTHSLHPSSRQISPSNIHHQHSLQRCTISFMLSIACFRYPHEMYN
jgi:hypothetical protein